MGSCVSMKSGLEGRNNTHFFDGLLSGFVVSMKSGLEGRNNTNSACTSMNYNTSQ